MKTMLLLLLLFLIGCEQNEQFTNENSNIVLPETTKYFKHIITEDCCLDSNVIIVEGKRIQVCDCPPMGEITKEEREHHNNNFSQIKWYSEKELK